ncbi:MAG: hypothetical protein L6R41_006613 [Letrouitia leprolyta]|nr:MAG: hypothetical protein L6R41_006613 [Letrouitia leprolyta]
MCWTRPSLLELPVYPRDVASYLFEFSEAAAKRLGTQVDRIIHDANSEIETLNQKISSLQIDRESLQSENTKIRAAFQEKSRKHQQTQELYDRLKRKEMTAVTQSAAFESVDDVLGSVNARAGQARPPQQPYSSRSQEARNGMQHPYNLGQDLNHHRVSSNGSSGRGGVTMPPPIHRPEAFGGHLFNTGISRQIFKFE